MSDLISRVKAVKKGSEANGAFVRGVQDKMKAIIPDLEHAGPQMIAQLYHVCCDIEGYIGMQIANKMERDYIAHEQQKTEKLQRSMKKKGTDELPDQD